ARLPEELPTTDKSAAGPAALDALRDCFDRRQQVEPAAALVHGYLAAGLPAADLVATLGHLVLREDAGFHMYQTLEAGARLYGSLAERDPAAARRVLVCVARYLAAHRLAPRSLSQPAR